MLIAKEDDGDASTWHDLDRLEHEHGHLSVIDLKISEGNPAKVEPRGGIKVAPLGDEQVINNMNNEIEILVEGEASGHREDESSSENEHVLGKEAVFFCATDIGLQTSDEKVLLATQASYAATKEPPRESLPNKVSIVTGTQARLRLTGTTPYASEEVVCAASADIHHKDATVSCAFYDKRS